MKILVADYEPQIRRALKTSFEQENFKVFMAVDGEEALAVAADILPEVIILQLIMPGLDGFAVCSQLREWSNVPLIVMSPSDLESDKIAALDLGADDYVVKPFGFGEMKARVRALLRRANVESGSDASRFSCDGLTIDYLKREVRLDGKVVQLTPKEYDLLRYMAKNADRVLTTRHLTDRFWGSRAGDNNHTLRVHVANLRNKVERNPESPRFILTEVRVGYRFKTGLSIQSRLCSINKLNASGEADSEDVCRHR